MFFNAALLFVYLFIKNNLSIYGEVKSNYICLHSFCWLRINLIYLDEYWYWSSFSLHARLSYCKGSNIFL